MSGRWTPIETPVLTIHDTLHQVLREHARPYLQPGSTVAVAESVVAILQGRVIRPEALQPSLAARLLARGVARVGSLSSPYAMQALMREHGTLRVSAAGLLAALSRLALRRRGDFYRLAGPQAELIDDVSGTMPPYDKYIVLGPAHPETVVRGVRRTFGVEAVIIDANDLGRVTLVAATDGVDRGEVTRYFRSNPWGNAEERRPIAIYRPAP